MHEQCTGSFWRFAPLWPAVKISSSLTACLEPMHPGRASPLQAAQGCLPVKASLHFPCSNFAVTGQCLHAGVGQAGAAFAAPVVQGQPQPGHSRLQHPTPSAQLDSLASTLAGHAARLARWRQSMAVAVTPPSPGDSPAGASPSSSPLPQLNPLLPPARLPGRTAGAHGAPAVAARSGAQQAPGQGPTAAAAALNGAHAAGGPLQRRRRQLGGSDTLAAAGPVEDIAIVLSSGSEDSDFAPAGGVAVDTSMDELEGAWSTACLGMRSPAQQWLAVNARQQSSLPQLEFSAVCEQAACVL